MLQDAIRLAAAALCCEKKKTPLKVTPDPALGRVLELLLQFTAYADIAADGGVLLDPPVRAPKNITLRFTSLTKDLFYLCAGLTAKMDLVMHVDTVEGGVSDAELQALSNAMDGVLVYAKNARGIALSAFSADDGLNAELSFPPLFAAGALVGAAMADMETTFYLGAYEAAREVRWALDALKEFGNETVRTEDGGITVPTLKSRFHPKTGKRIRKKT